MPKPEADSIDQSHIVSSPNMESQIEKLLKDTVLYAAPDGTQDDGDFVGFYVIPTGPIHRVIAYFQDKGGIQPMGDVSVISRYQAHLQDIIVKERIDEVENIGKTITEKVQSNLMVNPYEGVVRLIRDRIASLRTKLKDGASSHLNKGEDNAK